MNFKKIDKFINSFWIKVVIIVLLSFIPVIIASKIFITKQIKEGASIEKFTNHLNQRIPNLMKDYDIAGLNISLIKKGEIAWTKAFGYADITKEQKMTIDTYCRVESISKSVTAWGIMKLVEQGKLDLNKPVDFYIQNWSIPESKFAEEDITAGLLLSNTAGLPLGTIGPEALYSPEENIPSIEEILSKEVVLIQKPGKSFHYSDTGFNLLELLVEEVSGQAFANYMKETILKPIGMGRSSYTWNGEWNPSVPNGYDVDGSPVPVYTYSTKASGNLYSTVEDIAMFVAAGMTNLSNDHNVLEQRNIEKLYQPVVEEIPGYYGFVFDSYGFGHYIEWFANGEKAVSHGGQGTGWMSHFQSVPETGDGIVILTNSQRSWPAFAYILSDWTAWSGFSSAGMERIIMGQKVLWFIIALLIFVILWRLWGIIEGLITGRRRFAPGAKESRLLRMVELVISIVLIGGVYYAVTMEYQPLYSIFPIASHWLFYSLFITGVVLLFQVLFPCEQGK
ncbi:MAG: serine hydrolase domain-containing protein [Halothermotrichaceae bacterium]